MQMSSCQSVTFYHLKTYTSHYLIYFYIIDPNISVSEYFKGRQLSMFIFFIYIINAILPHCHTYQLSNIQQIFT